MLRAHVLRQLVKHLLGLWRLLLLLMLLLPTKRLRRKTSSAVGEAAAERMTHELLLRRHARLERHCLLRWRRADTDAVRAAEELLLLLPDGMLVRCGNAHAVGATMTLSRALLRILLHKHR